MNNQKTIAQFMRFMKQNRAWAAFKINIKDKSLQSIFPPLPYKPHGCVNVPFYIRECPPLYYVTRSFSWEFSPQGYYYWCKIDKDWDEDYALN